ncbi:MAG: RtcB family protein [Planctomycetota bacterium]|nr:MAG: RtcB family protein [Planctomycetota bacterium]
MSIKIKQVEECVFEIPKEGKMRVPGRIYADKEMMETILQDKSPEQVQNVACLPGIVGYSYAMPDIHWGYGFPIGGVAAFDENEGVVSPGGVGYDINCGVRLLKTNLSQKDLEGKKEKLANRLFKDVPTGVGSKGAIPKLSQRDMEKMATKGAKWAIEEGYGNKEDTDYIEEKGCLQGADPALVSERAYKRGSHQLGTLGSGNHFLEVDVISEIYDSHVAQALGLFVGQICVVIHTGSRGFGYQICEDSLKIMKKAVHKYGIQLADPQLACAPLGTPEANQYLAMMACGANFAWANRQIIMSLAKKSFMHTFGIRPKDLGFEIIYDVCHNIAKFEEHEVEGEKKRLCVHRKGATRAFPPHHPLTPKKYKEVGQPVLIPGDMGRYSYVLVGQEDSMKKSFGSSCHGAGRVMSRAKSKKKAAEMDMFQTLDDYGVIVKAKGKRTIAEEMPHAYKDVAEVVDIVERAGLSKKVAQLKPLIVVKG